jgi:hypothetical protein
MSVLKKTHYTLVTAAAVATVLMLILTILSTFFPDKIAEMTTSFTGPAAAARTPAGTLRAGYVSSQVAVFLYVSGIVVLLSGALMSAAHHWSSGASARSIALGRGSVRWLKFVLIACPALLTVVLGIYLPRAIFQPTNEEELGRQFFFGAWALRSLLGGFVLGLTYLLIAGLLAYLGYVLFIQIRRSFLLGRVRRQLES